MSTPDPQERSRGARPRTPTGIAVPLDPPADLALVPSRTLVDAALEVNFPLAPGDRALTEVGATVVAGAPVAERYRARRLVEVEPSGDGEPVPGARWVRPGGAPERPARGRRTPPPPEGELLFPWRGRWRVAAGEHPDPVEAPVTGVVRSVEPGIGVVLRAAGRALRGTRAIGSPTRGTLELAATPSGELRPGGVDVGSAGAILVVGSRVDAETLTRARAMGVRGIVVAGLPSKDQRDYLASEARQRAALHRLQPFAVLVLDGAVRRPIASPIMQLLAALEGREVAIVTDPPALVFDADDVELPAIPPDLVRVRSGPDTGREGRWLGSVGPRRFAGGVHLEAGRVRFPEGSAIVPLGDLERFA